MKKFNKSIIVGLSGGLGNQMFQYAAGRSLSLRLNMNLILDLSWFNTRKDRIFNLNKFKIDVTTVSYLDFVYPQLQSFISRVSRRWSPIIMGKKVWKEPHFHFTQEFETISQPVYLDGYWQSEKYFSDITQIIKDDLIIKDEINHKDKELKDKILNSNSICVHIRRGDYITNSVANKIHGHCSIEYYKKGIDIISYNLESPHLFIFSDDIEWVRNNMHFDFPKTFIGGGILNSHIDMHLMNNCQNFIIANSTFSWWAAWLGNYVDKKIVCPKNWFNSNEKDTRDLYPKNWIII